MRLKKFPNEAKESSSNFHKINEINYHFKQVISFYNNALPYIESLPSFHIGYFFATQLLIELAFKHTSFKNKTLLEIGCGLGNTLLYLSNKYNMKCTGIDLNLNQIEKLNFKIRHDNLAKKVAALELNALKIEPNLGKFDIVWSEDSFSHIPNRGVLFRNIYNILDKNGILVFSDLVKKEKISNDELDRQQKAWCLWNLESNESYKKIIKDSGFEILASLENIGQVLLNEHIKIDLANGDIDHDSYLNHLKNNQELLITEWDIYNYTRRFERLMTYKYLESEKLDYNFFIAVKE